RKALPTPERKAGLTAEYQPPTNETEEKLTTIWQQVLGMKQIGISDNFFEIGGHSLKAINLISKIKKTFQVELPLPELFKKPYIKDQALFIENAAKAVFKAIRPVEEKEFYPLSAAQKRMYTLNRFAPGSVNYNMPGALILEGDVEATQFEKAFQKLVNRHESLRTSFHFIDGEPLQRIHLNVTFELQYIESDETKKENDENLLTQFLHPFDLTRTPLLRAAL
ncbi:MAG: hypothetical protein GY765_12480, partial [bacterium]|nr:hypothetical protein [bacterium]